jgi:hypothetical protein
MRSASSVERSASPFGVVVIVYPFPVRGTERRQAVRDG